MNNLQLAYSKIIHALVNIEDEKVDFNNGDLSYGLLNYIAKYSLAKDTYYISRDAYNLIEDIFDGFRQPLIRSAKQRNGFTYDHAIPVSIVKKSLLNLPNNGLKSVQDILRRSDFVTIITNVENNTLNESCLKQKLPNNIEWTTETEPFMRYNKANIEPLDNITISMAGAIIR